MLSASPSSASARPAARAVLPLRSPCRALCMYWSDTHPNLCLQACSSGAAGHPVFLPYLSTSHSAEGGVCRHSPAVGGRLWLQTLGAEARRWGFLWHHGLRAVPKGQLGLDFPWLHSKAWQGDTSPPMAELRGMSVSGEEWMEGGHPLALAVLSITLTRSP